MTMNSKKPPLVTKLSNYVLAKCLSCQEGKKGKNRQQYKLKIDSPCKRWKIIKRFKQSTWNNAMIQANKILNNLKNHD